MAVPKLVIERGEGRGQEIDLDRAIVVGRAPGCDIVLPDESCSRTHARITPEGERAKVEDLGSTNGTLVNGERATVGFAQDGDQITIGGTTLRYRRGTFDGGATVILSGAARDDAKVTLEQPVKDLLPPEESHAVELIEAASGMQGRSELARLLCLRLIQATGAERGCVLVFPPGTVDPREAEALCAPEMRLDPGRPWLARALKKRTALLLEDPGSGKRTLHGLVVPVLDGERPLVLGYADRRKAPFTPAELSRALPLLRAGAAMIGAAAKREPLRSELLEHRIRVRSDRRIVGESPPHLEVVNAVKRNARGAQPVLFIGETGTGKELFARLLHDLSQRAGGPFVAVNCSATPDGLLDVELLGAGREARGPYPAGHVGSLERATGGTLFLDEIDAMDLAGQARLASIVRERRLVRPDGGGEVALDVRLVAASDRDLSTLAENGTFHEELLAVLAMGTIQVPPLRERPEDVPLLADHFLKLHARRMNRPGRRLQQEALRALQAYRWPGNVRELSNVIERAVILSVSEEIGAAALPFTSDEPGSPADLALEVVEKAAILRALVYCNWKKGAAAKALGISWPTLNKKIGDYGIDVPEK